MNIIVKYEYLVEQGKWSEALPLIEEIVDRDLSCSTSWFNHGVCLTELQLHKEAAASFSRAYELEPTDFGAMYRMFLSLYNSNDKINFLEILKGECEINPEMINDFIKDEDFSRWMMEPPFKEYVESLRKRSTNGVID